jgi:molybdopterin-guanine dinucleotide biosynthesis protein A
VKKGARDSADHAAAFVLAGGRSSRMGEDKALLQLAGQPLVGHALAVLGAAGLTARIAGARADLDRFAPIIADETADCGPLGGICSALDQTDQKWAVFVPVDMPLLPSSLVKYLVADARLTGLAVTLVSVNGFVQTFPAVIRTETLPALRKELESGVGGCFAAFTSAVRLREESIRAVPVEMLAQSGQVADPRGLAPYQWFLNVNTREDLERTSAALTLRIAQGAHRII